MSARDGDSDETAGRALYRGMADARASFDARGKSIRPGIRKSVLDLIVGGQVSDRAIAESHNVSRHFVSKVRREFEAQNARTLKRARGLR